MMQILSNFVKQELQLSQRDRAMLRVIEYLCHLRSSCIIYKIERDICRKSRFFHTPLHSTPPLRGPRCHTAWREKLECYGYPTVKKLVYI